MHDKKICHISLTHDLSDERKASLNLTLLNQSTRNETGISNEGLKTVCSLLFCSQENISCSYSSHRSTRENVDISPEPPLWVWHVAKCITKVSINCFSLYIPEILLHPFLQLFGDLLFLPFADICHKHSRVEGAVSGVDAQIFHFLFPVVQEAHVGCLWDELRGEDAIFQWANLLKGTKWTLWGYYTQYEFLGWSKETQAQVNTQRDKMIHLHADAAHHLMGGGQVTVSGESSSMTRLQFDIKQILDITWNDM